MWNVFVSISIKTVLTEYFIIYLILKIYYFCTFQQVMSFIFNNIAKNDIMIFDNSILRQLETLSRLRLFYLTNTLLISSLS